MQLSKLNPQTIRSRVLQVVSDQLGIPPEELTPQSDLQKDLNAQKLEIADLLTTIENEFKISLPEEKIEEIQTVEDLINLVVDALP